ncbi:hypothetical protein RJ639_011190 [Escallonia herrerae]|uniref:Uncharacterized protein n=1 Tax=Escallonia herrerae TaxID=1293975 RepID=A0AA89APY1_9ASTE|nr:hypothetical protein RJ639_011190 [Escallonia herrerae]
MATTLSVRPSRAILCRDHAGSPRTRPPARRPDTAQMANTMSKKDRSWWGLVLSTSRRTLSGVLQAGSGSGFRADDSAPFEMSVENALKLLGVSDGASFEDILRAKNSIVAGCKDDQDMIAQVRILSAQTRLVTLLFHDWDLYTTVNLSGCINHMPCEIVEAAYDMLLMQSLSQRRSGKVVNSSIRYADVKTVSAPTMGSMPQWLQGTIKSSPISVEAPSTGDLGIQAGVYGALMVLTYVNGSSTSSGGSYGGADVPGLILATSFGASLYFMTKKKVKLVKFLSTGKATVITIGGLVAGAVVGSAVENWLQVDIVPFLGIHSPATVVSEFIILSQFLVSLYLR